MPWNRPTRQELIDRAIADLTSRVPGGDASLRRSNLNILARVNAGGLDGLYGYLDWLADQLFPDTAVSDNLARWASIWGLSRLAAAFATGSIQIAAATGTLIPGGTVVQRADGLDYATDADLTLSTGVATVSATALSAGALGNTSAGTALTLVTPIDGVTAITVPAPGLLGGVDAETDAALRTRLLQRIQTPPQGGSANDYVEWAMSIAGVTRVWVYPSWLGAATVGVFIAMDGAATGPLPDGATIAAVQAYINSVRPVTAAVTVLAPTLDAVNYSIQLTPNTAAVKAAIQAALVDLHTREGNSGGTLLLSHINEAISLAAGETDHVLVAPTANVVTAPGHLPVVGTLTWL